MSARIPTTSPLVIALGLDLDEVVLFPPDVTLLRNTTEAEHLAASTKRAAAQVWRPPGTVTDRAMG